MPTAEEPPAISAMLSSANDLDVPLTEDDIDLVEEFEARWRGYMHDNPDMMPASGRSKRVAELKSKILKAKMNTTVVERELKEQLQLFTTSREAIEQKYQTAIQKATAAHKPLEDKLERELDNAVMADRLESQLVPWEHFLDSVDKAVPSPRAPNDKRTMTPSARAIQLLFHEYECNGNDRYDGFLLLISVVSIALIFMKELLETEFATQVAGSVLKMKRRLEAGAEDSDTQFKRRKRVKRVTDMHYRHHGVIGTIDSLDDTE